MFEFLESLRSKPSHKKKQFAFLASFIITGIIFSFWVGVIFPDWKISQNKQDYATTREPSPLSAFTDSLANSLGSIGEQFTNLKASVATFGAAPEHYSATSSSQISTTTSE